MDRDHRYRAYWGRSPPCAAACRRSTGTARPRSARIAAMRSERSHASCTRRCVHRRTRRWRRRASGRCTCRGGAVDHMAEELHVVTSACRRVDRGADERDTRDVPCEPEKPGAGLNGTAPFGPATAKRFASAMTRMPSPAISARPFDDDREGRARAGSAHRRIPRAGRAVRSRRPPAPSGRRRSRSSDTALPLPPSRTRTP